MRRFTATLFGFSLLFLLAASPQKSFEKGYRIVSKNSPVPSFYDYMPDQKKELELLLSLIREDEIAILFGPETAGIALDLAEALVERERKVALVFEYKSCRESFQQLVKRLVDLRSEGKDVKTLVFLGSYKEATCFVPAFKIFVPPPKVVASWRIASRLVFAYRNLFPSGLVYYDWFTPFLPKLSERGFCLKFQKTYGELPDRYAFLGFLAAQGEKPELKVVDLKKIPALLPLCRLSSYP